MREREATLFYARSWVRRDAESAQGAGSLPPSHSEMELEKASPENAGWERPDMQTRSSLPLTHTGAFLHQEPTKAELAVGSRDLFPRPAAARPRSRQQTPDHRGGERGGFRRARDAPAAVTFPPAALEPRAL